MADESIIEVIQKMVQEGQPREKILQTLHDLGVSEEQSKKLLLIAEADTFTLLRKEIGSIVKDEFGKQKSDFESIIHTDLEKIENEESAKLQGLATTALAEAKTQVIEQSKNFESRINKAIDSSQKTVSMVKAALDSINERVSTMDLDIEQLKVHKYRRKSMFFSYSMLVLGGLLLAVALMVFILNFDKIDSEQILLIGVMMIASIALMFASIIG